MLDALLNEQKKELMRFGTESLTAQFRKLVQESDDMSENSAAMYLDGKLNEDEFIKVFKESRKLYYSRSAKLDKIN